MASSLDKYNTKRDFSKTGEPRGRKGRGSKWRYSFQKHAASTLHYDLRLEVDGVLKSWAVPKGPSTDPGVKRLAIQTEDHPVDYIDFEGVIPEGEYGAGKVIVWDLGTYRNINQKEDGLRSMEDSLDEGHCLVELNGEKLKGGYALQRIDRKKGHWLLIKMDDDHADARRNPVSTQPKSVKSGKKVEEITEKDGVH